jgi:hypothetical protein
MSKEKVNITMKRWDYTCGDGCCSDSGTDVTVNGVKVTEYGNIDYILISSVLNALGYDVDITFLDEDDEEVSTWVTIADKE